MSERWVYLNHEFVPESQARLSIVDRGLIMGATVTEMTRTFHQRAFRLEDHVARLYRSLKFVRINVGLTPEEMRDRSLELLERNLPTADEEGREFGIIHFATPGPLAYYADLDPATVQPTICIHMFPLRWGPYARCFLEGIHLVTPSTRHVPPQCIDPKMKYRSRMHYYLADQEAALIDPQAQAILLDLDGNLTETSGANFLLARDGVIYTPTTRNTLPGVSRATIFELAAEMGIRVVETDLQPHDAVNADEAFLSTTPYCAAPVTRFNGLPVGDGRPGPILKRLLTAWGKRVDLDIVAQVTDGRMDTASLGS